jgi:hypothetical protein
VGGYRSFPGELGFDDGDSVCHGGEMKSVQISHMTICFRSLREVTD